MEESVASLAAGDDVKPYKIHVSSKYLDLTRKKLELTRLPHEILLPVSREWEIGTPKSAVEPLIDFWLENYQWRTQENRINSSIPQFRAVISTSTSPAPLRIHFVHVKSPHANAIPLLLLPSFPLTNLSLMPLFTPLADPQDPQDVQPYHVIAPSIPGLGFSDPLSSLPGEQSLLEETAEIFNSLMLKLGYDFYLASSTGSGSMSPANIDYHLPRVLAKNFKGSCLGIHLIDPPSRPPTIMASPWHWTKFTVAKFFHANIFGYTTADWTALNIRTSLAALSKKGLPLVGEILTRGNIARLGLREPNTIAYALCDSPVGLLSLVLNRLRRISPNHNLSRTEIIDITQLAWLPGPESAMRYWAGALAEIGKEIKFSGTPTGITVFEEGEGVIMPAWAGMRHRVVCAMRQPGLAGLVAVERVEALVDGIRGLTAQVLKKDPRLVLPALEQVVVGEVIAEEVEEENGVIQLDVESPDTIVQV